MALFDAQDYWDEMRENEKPEKREIIHKYEAKFGSLKDLDIRQTRFYRYYLSAFDYPFRVNIPEGLEDEFDWDLLCRLIAASYSSEMRLVINPEWLKNPTGQILIDIYIKVNSEGKEVEKRLDELWSYQILRLFEIYIDEQMNILVTIYEEDEENDDDDINDEDDGNDDTECDGAHLPTATDNKGYLGEERLARIKKFNQQIESIRARMNAKEEEKALGLLLDELQEQSR